MSKTELLLERVHLGEATDAERSEVLADPDLFARLRTLQDQDDAFEGAYDRTEQIAAIHRRAHLLEVREATKRRRTLMGGVGLFVPLAVAATVMFAQPAFLFDRGEVPEERAKGMQPHLIVHQAGAKGNAVVKPGAMLQQGDVLQLGYVAAGAAHGVVVSIDGAGALTLHQPASVGGSTALGRGEVNIPHGYQLDDAPVFERFFFVTSAQPIDVQVVLDAAEALAGSPTASTAPLALAGKTEQTSFTVYKASQ